MATKARDIDDGLATFKALFRSLGLPDSLAGWLKQRLQAGDTNDEITEKLYLRAEFKARFPGITERQKKGLAPISPMEYVAYENGMRQAFMKAGVVLPVTGDKFNKMVTGLLSADVSIAELVNDRIGTAYKRVAEAPAEVKQAAERLWGIHGEAALATFFLDPHESADSLDELSQAMSAAGTADRAGFTIGKDTALKLADADVSASTLEQQMQYRPLFDESVSETEISDDTAVLGLAGADQEAQAQTHRRMEERKAAFGGGTASSGAERGLVGLGEGTAV